MKPRTVIISAQGETIHIKSKQTGRVILRLKLRPDPHLRGEYEMLVDMCGGGAKYGAVSYLHDITAGREIDRYEVQP